MSLYVTVRDKKRGIERQITRRAYQLQQNRYELLEGEAPQTVKKSVNAAAAPAEVEVIETGNDVIAQPKKRGPKPKQA